MFHKKGKKLFIILAAVIAVGLLLIVAGIAVLVPHNYQMGTVEWAVPVEEPVAESAPAPMPPADGGRAQASPGFGVSATKDMAAVVTPVSQPEVETVDRKIIKSAYMALDTVDFERTTDAVMGKAVAMGGYVESSSVQGTRLFDRGQPSRRTANFQIRIPEEQFEAFMSAVGELGVVTTEQITGQDITGQYFDTETRVRTLKVQEERLLALLARADKLTDIIEIERELSRIRFDIESLTGTLKGWDHMVNFSRVNIDVYEVEELKEIEPKPGNWLDRISRAFRDSIKNLVSLFENLVIFLVAAIPYLAILAAIGWGVWKALRKKVTPKKIEGGNIDEK
jgi:hypothetical protein